MNDKVIALGYKILNSKIFSRIFRSYKLIWELAGLTKRTAMNAVLYGVKDEQEFWSSGERIAEKLRKFVDKNSIVLDVGCGIGRIERFLAPYCR